MSLLSDIARAAGLTNGTLPASSSKTGTLISSMWQPVGRSVPGAGLRGRGMSTTMTLTELSLTASDGLVFDGYAPCRRSAVSRARKPVSCAATSRLSVVLLWLLDIAFNNGFRYYCINVSRLSPHLSSNWLVVSGTTLSSDDASLPSLPSSMDRALRPGCVIELLMDKPLRSANCRGVKRLHFILVLFIIYITLTAIQYRFGIQGPDYHLQQHGALLPHLRFHSLTGLPYDDETLTSIRGSTTSPSRLR